MDKVSIMPNCCNIGEQLNIQQEQIVAKVPINSLGQKKIWPIDSDEHKETGKNGVVNFLKKRTCFLKNLNLRT